MPTLPRARCFALHQLADGDRTARDISLCAVRAGLNRRHDGEDAWADLSLRHLCDLGLVEQTGECDLASIVYRITSAGRRAAQ